MIYLGVYSTENATETLPDDYTDYELNDYVEEMYDSLLNKYFYYPQDKEVTWMDIVRG